MMEANMYCPFCKKTVIANKTEEKKDVMKIETWTCAECDKFLASAESYDN